jgi:hypothetical protein
MFGRGDVVPVNDRNTFAGQANISRSTNPAACRRPGEEIRAFTEPAFESALIDHERS